MLDFSSEPQREPIILQLLAAVPADAPLLEVASEPVHTCGKRARTQNYTKSGRPRATKRTVPGTTNSLFTTTSKMPGRSWSIPAHRACPGAVVTPSADGRPAICGACYAAKGAYVWRVVRECQNARYAWAVRCMKTEAGRREFVSTMVDGIRRTRGAEFRVHD